MLVNKIENQLIIGKDMDNHKVGGFLRQSVCRKM